MISRLTALAAVFAVLATASLTYAAGEQHQTAAKATPIVQLQTVVVTGKRVAN